MIKTGEKVQHKGNFCSTVGFNSSSVSKRPLQEFEFNQK